MEDNIWQLKHDSFPKASVYFSFFASLPPKHRWKVSKWLSGPRVCHRAVLNHFLFLFLVIFAAVALLIVYYALDLLKRCELLELCPQYWCHYVCITEFCNYMRIITCTNQILIGKQIEFLFISVISVQIWGKSFHLHSSQQCRVTAGLCHMEKQSTGNSLEKKTAGKSRFHSLLHSELWIRSSAQNSSRQEHLGKASLKRDPYFDMVHGQEEVVQWWT